VILAAAIASGGSTLRDYVDADGKQGASQFAHKVYGRGGEACTACGGVLRTATIAQRTTVWCPTCQK
jgi:formamidopyrimidine-DNA glycosylase